MLGHLVAVAGHGGPEHHPLVDRRGPGQRLLQRPVDVGPCQLGQESQVTEIDAEDRDVAPGQAHAVGHGQERAVAAEDEEQVDEGR